jgi:hypothetical protein
MLDICFFVTKKRFEVEQDLPQQHQKVVDPFYGCVGG